MVYDTYCLHKDDTVWVKLTVWQLFILA